MNQEYRSGFKTGEQNCEEKRRLRPDQAEEKKSQVEKTAVTLKLLEVFDRELTSGRNKKETIQASSPATEENDEESSLPSNSFSIESILSRKDPPQTERKATLSAENVGQSFRIEQLLDSNREKQKRVNNDSSDESSCGTTAVSNSIVYKVANSESTCPERTADVQENAKEISSEVSTRLAPFYVPLAKHTCSAYQIFRESHVSSKAMLSQKDEMFENFRSSSILRLRTKAEEHLKQLQVS